MLSQHDHKDLPSPMDTTIPSPTDMTTTHVTTRLDRLEHNMQMLHHVQTTTSHLTTHQIHTTQNQLCRRQVLLHNLTDKDYDITIRSTGSST
jgi:hypothetical protein